jgi:hypothetical protein
MMDGGYVWFIVDVLFHRLQEPHFIHISAPNPGMP